MRLHQWGEATDRYDAYLRRVPDDVAIWVQLGHASKETGDSARAERAYRTAAALAPDDPDATTHLAHMLKALGRRDEAGSLFSDVMRQAPSMEVARELQAVGRQSVVTLHGRPAGVGPNARYVELRDLLQYLSVHVTVTGITRVTLGLLHHILEQMPAAESANYHFVQKHGDGVALLLLPRERVRWIVHAAMQDKADLAAMQATIAEIRTTSPVFQPTAGDLYLIVGAFWEFVENPSWINGMRQRGLAVGAYIYDLIPITHAQYCVDELTRAFTLAFAETARLLDFAMTISSFVADEVCEFLDAHHVPRFPVVPVPLAHELRFEGLAQAPRADVANIPPRRYLTDIPFVLCVCTIEARKNHVYLFRIWQMMMEAGLDVPDLVFVGRPGWRVEDLLAEIDASDHLGGRLHILHGLSDDELGDLYDRCLFTAFPSFVEGWGLPVGESLAHGKLCVASSASSIPEVGGAFALYVDPFDLADGYRVISELVRDRPALAARERLLRETFRPRTWRQAGEAFFRAVDEGYRHFTASAAGRRLFAPVLPEARVLRINDLVNVIARGKAYPDNPQRLMFAAGWRTAESTGTWLLDRDGLLRIQTASSALERVSVLLRLNASPWVGAQNVLEVGIGVGEHHEVAYRRPLRADADFWISVEGPVDADGVLSVRLRVQGAVVTADPGAVPVSVRLRAIGYAAAAAPDERNRLLEHALLS